MTRNMEPPDNLIDQIYYDVCHGRIKGDEILVTASQMQESNKQFDLKLKDGGMMLGKIVRLTEGKPSSKYPPDIPNEEWTVGGLCGGNTPTPEAFE